MINRFKVPEEISHLDSKTPERDGDLMQSDSEPGEMIENNAPAASQAEDREEDRKFLAMLELTPRNAVEAANVASSAPASRSESPCVIAPESKSDETVPQLLNGTKVKVDWIRVLLIIS